MLRLFPVFLLLFSAILFRFPAFHLSEPGSVQFLWFYDLTDGASTEFPSEWKNFPFNGVAIHESKGTVIVQPEGRRIKIGEEERVSVPFLGGGYFRYMKVGKEIFYHSRESEILWRKPYFSYPVTDARGRIVMLLTGDSNRVDIVDSNGNPSGVKSIAGNFLTDYDFAVRAERAAACFASGDLHVIGESGRAVAVYRHETDIRPTFLKSCSISPDGSLLAFHMLEQDRDRIYIYRVDEGSSRLKKETSIDLPVIYPHLLHFALNESGLLLSAPDILRFYSLNGKEIWSTKQESSGVYHPVYADRDFFVYGQAGRLIAADDRGRTVLEAPVFGAEQFWRILPSREEHEFAVDTGSSVQFFRFRSYSR